MASLITELCSLKFQSFLWQLMLQLVESNLIFWVLEGKVVGTTRGITTAASSIRRPS